MSLLTVANLKKSFPISGGCVRAVDGVDFHVDKGETLGLVGESGCGKSTLGRCILRLIEPSAGSVSFSETDLLSLRGEKLRAMRRRIQAVFQDPFASLDPRWRVGDILEEALRVHNIVPLAQRPGEVDRLLDSVGLSAGVSGRYPHEFSGGQRQRIGIARAMAVRPDFLVADEAVSALDVSIRAQILNLLIESQRRTQFGMLFIGHDLGVIRQISHRVAVMYLGKIVEEGATSQLYEDPRHPYTRALLQAIPTIKDAGARRLHRQALDGDVPSPVAIPTGCRFHTRCPFAQDICRREEPGLSSQAGSPDHRSACHFSATLPPFERPAVDTR